MNHRDLWELLITVNGPDLLVLPGNMGKAIKDGHRQIIKVITGGATVF